MKHRAVLIVLLTFLILSSCIKESYDMDKLSGEVALNPILVVQAVKGEVSLGDLVEPNDTIVFDEGLLKLVYGEESIIDFRLEDFYSSFPPVSFEKTTPVASISVSDKFDISVDAGDDVKLKTMKVSSGYMNYDFKSWCSFDINLELKAPSIDDDGEPLVLNIAIPQGGTASGTLDLAGVLVNFDSDPLKPYNMLPIEYDISVLADSPGFNLSDSVNVKIEMGEPEFDYATGYFGNLSEESERETIDLDMEDLFSKLSGSIFISSPSLTVNYLNSFGVPMRINAEVKGINDKEEISLDRDPIDIEYPTSADAREVNSSFSIDKTNSSLPELISMLPYEIEFYGSASINPDGETMDNIIFGDSRFSADVEVEVPMEFRIANLQLSDTIENPFKPGDGEEDNPLDMLEELQLNLYVENGFPLGVSVVMQLYDSGTSTILESISTDDLFTAAPVDANGRVTAPSSGKVSIDFTPGFIDSANEADEMIISFTLNTSDGGSKDVKIYSDYGILFKIAVWVKTGINVNFNSEDK